MKKLMLLSWLVANFCLASCSLLERGGGNHDHGHHHHHGSEAPLREGRQQGSSFATDFSRAYLDPSTGLQCVDEEASVQSLGQERLLECVHRMVSVCHYTYETRFTSQRQQECTDNYEKVCSISFKGELTSNDTTVLKCYTPKITDCSGQQPSDSNEEVCKTVYESDCSTRYVERRPGKFVGETDCQKVPVKLCGSPRCRFVDGPEECHNTSTANVIDVPEETCDLVPQKTCRGVYKLVPHLVPVPECAQVPKEVCSFGVTGQSLKEKPIVTKWCYDPTDSTRPRRPSETKESNRAGTGRNKFGVNNINLPDNLPHEGAFKQQQGPNLIRPGSIEEDRRPFTTFGLQERPSSLGQRPSEEDRSRFNVLGHQGRPNLPGQRPNQDDRRPFNALGQQERPNSIVQGPHEEDSRKSSNTSGQKKRPNSGRQRQEETTKFRHDEGSNGPLNTFGKPQQPYSNRHRLQEEDRRLLNTFRHQEGPNADRQKLNERDRGLLNPFGQKDRPDSQKLNGKDKPPFNSLNRPSFGSFTPSPTQRPFTLPPSEVVIGTEGPNTAPIGDVFYPDDEDNATPPYSVDFLEDFSLTTPATTPRGLIRGTASADIQGNPERDGKRIPGLDDEEFPSTQEDLELLDYTIEEYDFEQGDGEDYYYYYEDDDEGSFVLGDYEGDSTTPKPQLQGLTPALPVTLGVPNAFPSSERPGQASRTKAGRRPGESGVEADAQERPFIKDKELAPDKSDEEEGAIVFHTEVPEGFEPILEVVDSEEKDDLKIAEVVGGRKHKSAEKASLAKVINHKDSPVSKTVIIKNTPKAIKVFGIKNVPESLLQKGQENSEARPLSTRPLTSSPRERNRSKSTVNITLNPFLRQQGGHNNQGSNENDNIGRRPVSGHQSIASDSDDALNPPNLSFRNPKFGLQENKNLEQSTFTNTVDSTSPRGGKSGESLSQVLSQPGALAIGPIEIEEIFQGEIPTTGTEHSNSPLLIKPKQVVITTRGKPSGELQEQAEQLRSSNALFANPKPLLQLKRPEQILGDTQSPLVKKPGVHSFVRNPAITSAQNFAKPNNPPGPSKQELVIQQQQVVRQNTIKTHQSIIKPSINNNNNNNNFLFNEQENVDLLRTSRNPDKSNFRPPPTLMYGFKPMTTPSLSRPTQPPMPSTQGVFSPPDKLHYGFSPLTSSTTALRLPTARPFGPSPKPPVYVHPPQQQQQLPQQLRAPRKTRSLMQIISEMLEPLTKPLRRMMRAAGQFY